MDEKNEKTTEKTTEKRKGVGVNGNLVPMSMRSPEEVRALGEKGREAYKRKRDVEKSMQEIAKGLLNANMRESKVREILGDATELLQGDYTAGAVLILRQILEAQEGSTKAAEFIRDTSGNKPVEKQEISAEIMTENDRALLEMVAKRQGLQAGNTEN